MKAVATISMAKGLLNPRQEGHATLNQIIEILIFRIPLERAQKLQESHPIPSQQFLLLIPLLRVTAAAMTASSSTGLREQVE